MLVLPAAPPVALRGGGGVCTARGVCFLPSFGTCRSCSCVLRRPARLSVCPPAARSVLWSSLFRPGLFRGRMRGAEPGRTGQDTRGARRCAGP